MLPIKSVSIRTKVIAVTAICSSLALLLCAAGFVTYNVRTIQASKVEQIVTQARMLGFNSTAVLTFRNPVAAEELLSSLQSQPSVEFACLIDSQGEQLAAYRREGSNGVIVNKDKESGYEFTSDGRLHLYDHIVDDGNVVGKLFIRADMSELRSQLFDYSKIAASVLVCALGVSFGLSLILQRTISNPVVQLAETARRITTDHDYTIRVEPPSGDEIGRLYHSFNQMLDEIEISRNALKASVANMSHEIRTPINAILGFTDLLLRNSERTSEVVRNEYLTTIQSSGKHLLELINDILDLSKIEAGQLEVEKLPCSPHQILAEAVSVMRVRAQEKGLSLEYEWSTEVPDTIETDPGRLRQMLLNLVGNSIKFTSMGGVRVLARLVDYQTDPKLELDVVDSGIGIDKEKLEAIFCPFVQADSTVTRRFGGTGLGLAISRQIARALGGDLTVKSERERGSTFTMSIGAGPRDKIRLLDQPPTREIMPIRATENAQAEATDLTGWRVLIVDDGSTNRRLIDILMTEAGATVGMAENGRIAVEMAIQRPFDVILMDMQMPIMDGYTATRRLRSLGVKEPIIALTAHAMKGDEHACLEAGCSGFLTKPIDGARLLKTVESALAGKTPIEKPRLRKPHSPHPFLDPIVSVYPMTNPAFRELAEEFVERGREQLDAIRAARQRENTEELARLAHWLKGAGGTAGFRDFTEPAAQLEEACQNECWDRVDVSITKVDELLGRIVVPAAT